MKLNKFECPICGGSLTEGKEFGSYHCDYCRKTFIPNHTNDTFYKSKVRWKEMDHVERMYDKAIDQEKYVLTHESNETTKDWRRNTLFPIVFFVLLYAALIAYAHYNAYAPEKRHDNKVSELHEIEMQIEEAISNGDYNTALLKANQLYCDDYSSTDKKAWDEKRNTYIQIIETYIHDEEINNPNNIFMPTSSKEFKGMNYNEVIDQLSALGFTNILVQPASENAGWLRHKKDTVEHILIDGKTEFTNEDYFDKDSQIIIYYYSKK
jgi:hypothetical protein